MFLRLFEFSFIVLFLGFMISQVIIPLWRGTLMFPMFRKEAKLRAEQAAAEQANLEAEIQKRVDKIRAKVEKNQVKSTDVQQASGKPADQTSVPDSK